MPFFCAVPPTLPPSREGVRTFPGAGPYYVKEYRLNRKVEIRRNTYYGGNREHHVDGFDVDLSRSLAGRAGRPGRRRQSRLGVHARGDRTSGRPTG